MQTNVTRMLQAHGVAHEVITYHSGGAALDAASVARRIGVTADELFKTLVAHGDRNGLLVCCVPGSLELNPRKAAAAGADKRVALIASRDLLTTTGYRRGACSPIGMPTLLPTLIDETALLHDTIYVSAGVFGAQIRIAPTVLAQFVGARFADLT